MRISHLLFELRRDAIPPEPLRQKILVRTQTVHLKSKVRRSWLVYFVYDRSNHGLNVKQCLLRFDDTGHCEESLRDILGAVHRQAEFAVIQRVNGKQNSNVLFLSESENELSLLADCSEFADLTTFCIVAKKGSKIDSDLKDLFTDSIYFERVEPISISV